MEIAAYVLDINGEPLMPMSSYKRVRKMLKNNKAKVVRREPFTIKLLYAPKTKITQKITLAEDPGSGTIGYAAVSEDNKVLYASEVQVRNDITKKMTNRSKNRRDRRIRKLRYRSTRYNNRKNSKKKDRYSPTLISKFNSHVKEREFIKSILPITEVVREKAKFDPHLLKMQEEGKSFNKQWGYQKGELYGFSNVREACLNRDKYLCQYCKKKNMTLNVHHIISRANGGADTLDNLITLCERHHQDLHAGKLPEKFTKSLKGKRKSTLNFVTQMNTINSMLDKKYPDDIETWGYITKENRLKLSLKNTHYIDAIVMASGGKEVELPEYVYLKKSVSKGDYKLSMGVRGERKIPTGKIKGFRKFDKVKYFGETYFIKGRRTVGQAVLMDIYSNKIDFSYIPKGKKTPKLENCKRIQARSSTLCMRVKAEEVTLQERVK